MAPDPLQRDRIGGTLLITAALAGIVVLGLHPTAHDLLAPGALARQSRLAVGVHALALASIPVLFLGLLGLARRLGASYLTGASVVAFGFAGVAVLTAAVMSGFVATEMIGRMASAEAESRTLHRMLAQYTGLVNQGFAKVHLVGTSVSILLFSSAILKSRRMNGAAGAAGLVIGAGILLLFGSGHLVLDVHGFGIMTFAQSLWLIAVGILLWRAAPGGGPAPV